MRSLFLKLRTLAAASSTRTPLLLSTVTRTYHDEGSTFPFLRVHHAEPGTLFVCREHRV